MVSEEQMKTALRYIETAKREGGALAARRQSHAADSGGFYVEPTMFDQVAPDNTLAREEVFGPVLAVTRVQRAGRGVSASPTTPIYGLAAGLWTAGHRRSPTGRLARSAPVWSGSTAGTPATSRCRSAASSSRASVATAACTRLHKYADLKSVSITF